MSTIYIPIRVLLSERIRELIPKCMHAAAALFDRCMEPTADAHMMDKLKHLVTQAGEKFLIRPNASPIDRSSATSIRILQCDHAAIANARQLATGEWLPHIRWQREFCIDRRIMAPACCVSAFGTNRGSLGDGLAAEWRWHLPSHLFPEHDRAKELFSLLFRSSGGAK